MLHNGFGAARMPRSKWKGSLERRSREMLSRSLNLRTTVAFLGSGFTNAFGYLSWKDLVAAMLSYLKEEVGPNSSLEELCTKSKPKDRSGRPRSLTADELLYFLGSARQLGEANGVRVADFDEHLARLYRTRGVPHPPANPFPVLFKLPIRRFATTNWDCEIEYQLSQRARVKASSSRRIEPFLQWKDDKLEDWPIRSVAMRGAPDSIQRLFPFEELPEWFDRADRSFTQLEVNAEQFAEFVMARPRQEQPEMVFHCHGRCDDPHSIIATEADYQTWYLDTRESSRRSFRQTVELLLGSNPILFLGYGLRDEDLLRPLRVLGTSDGRYKDSRPLYALLPEWELSAFAGGAELLYEKYGVHVISYNHAGWKPEDKDWPWTKWPHAFLKALNELLDGWEKWQKDWIRKPKFRPLINPPLSHRKYIHHGFKLGTPIASKRLQSDITLILKRLKSTNLVLVGPGGAGKSYRGLMLAKPPMAKSDSSPYHRRFFWSSYYSDDWLSGLDRAIRFLGEEPSGDRMEQFRRLFDIAGATTLLVFDGFERLLRQTDDPTVGEPYNAAVSRFLEIVRRKQPNTQGKPAKGASTICEPAHVVITSRLLPLLPKERKLEMEKLEELKKQMQFQVAPLEYDDLEASFFKGLDRAKWRPICSVLKGHPFALRLAQAYLKSKNNTKKESRVRKAPTASPVESISEEEKLVVRLQRAHPAKAISEMVGLAVGQFEEWASRRAGTGTKTPAAGDVALGFLERIALFMSPVSDGALAVCYAEACKAASVPANLVAKEKWKTHEELVTALCDAHLVVAVEDDEERTTRWTLHPIVRGFVFHRLHRAKSDEMPNFTLAGFTTGTASVDPGSPEAGKLVKNLLEALMEGAEATKAADLCRMAFSLMRARMEATTAARWCPYDEYSYYTVRLLNLVKLLADEQLWSFADRRAAVTVNPDDPKGVLYPEELAWLYNELGLVCCCEGNMYDAIAVWEQGYEINKLVEEGARTGQFIVQSKLHLAHTFMELGGINTADQYLAETELANAELGSDDYKGRILGYKGLLNYLRGNIPAAEKCFGEATELLGGLTGNPRARCIFLRHWADLKIRADEKLDARKKIDESRALAEAHHYPDLVAYARKSMGHLLRIEGRYPKSRGEYEAALTAARRMGIRRLEADVLSELSHLALDQGDPESARSLALEGMRIANELGLGIRQCHGLVVLGRANLKLGRRGFAVACLRLAERLSRESGYWLRAQVAEEQLRILGEARD